MRLYTVALLLLLAAPFVDGQCPSTACGGAASLYSSYSGTGATYGWYVRNQAPGLGVNLRNGWGNFGGAYVWNPTGGSTGVGSGLLMIAANGDHNYGGIARATTFKANATNVGFASWAYNEDAQGNESGRVVGLFASLAELPDSKAAIDAEIGTRSAAAIFDTGDGTGDGLIVRNDGTPVLTVPRNGTLALANAGVAKPTCDAAHELHIWPVAGAPGVATTLEACLKNASDVYAWAPVAYAQP